KFLVNPNLPKPSRASVLSALLIGCLSSVVCAESLAPMTWEDCVRRAARNNPDLISSARAVDANRALYKGSYNGILPKVTLTNSYNDSSGTNGTESKLWQLQGTVNLDLINVGQWAAIQSASSSLHLSQANLDVSNATILLSLYKAFAALLYAQE